MRIRLEIYESLLISVVTVANLSRRHKTLVVSKWAASFSATKDMQVIREAKNIMLLRLIIQMD